MNIGNAWGVNEKYAANWIFVYNLVPSAEFIQAVARYLLSYVWE